MVVVGTIISYLSAPVFFRALRYVREFIFGSDQQNVLKKEGIRVFVKTNDKIVPVQLSPKWSIAQVRHHLAGFVGKDADELRIIVAGHELRDDVEVGECDLGESTVIHAVKVIHRPISLSSQTIEARKDAFARNLNETLISTPKSTKVHTKQGPLTGFIEHNENDTQFKGDQPMNACLLDLQLTEEERIVHENKKLQESHVPALSSQLGDKNNLQNDTENCLQQPKIEANVNEEKAKAHFWVYCSNSACGRTIQPGKLRVRCETCREGAIIVTSDPCSWEDVLNSGKIQGYCQNGNCPEIDGSESIREGAGARLRPVQFYFKCSGPNHNRNNKSYTASAYISNDSGGEVDQSSSVEAPPLYLIRSNLKDVPCLG